MNQYQYQQPRPPAPVEACGTGRIATWDGRALVIRARIGGEVTSIPARQVATAVVRPLDLAFIVTTTDGRSHMVRYWPGTGAAFRELRDAVLAGAAAV